MRRHEISGLPVVDADGRPVGILTNRDVRFERNLDQPVSAMMTKKLVTVAEGTTLESAKELLHKNRIEKLLVVDGGGMLKGLITIKDIEKAQQHPTRPRTTSAACASARAVGVGPDRDERVDALLEAGCDVICIDTAHGHSRGVLEAVRRRPQELPQGARSSPATSPPPRATLALIEAGADAVKVGIGPGSICTTRVVAGVGVPQLTAIADCAQRRWRDRHRRSIADGGIKYSGDVAKALAAGAHTRDDRLAVRRHRRGAGRDHPVPGPQLQGVPRHGLARRDERRQPRTATSRPTSTSDAKLVPEGIEGRVPYRGSLSQSIYQLIGGLRVGHGLHRLPHHRRAAHQGALRARDRQGLRESHVHDVIITKEAPNYRVEQ